MAHADLLTDDNIEPREPPGHRRQYLMFHLHGLEYRQDLARHDDRTGFHSNFGYSSNGGSDTANFYDSSGNDNYYAYASLNGAPLAEMTGNGTGAKSELGGTK